MLRFLETSNDRFDYIHLDIWPDARTPIAGMRSAHRAAQRCLKRNGRAWTWLQDNARLIEERLAMGPKYVGKVGTHPPCKACGKVARADYAGLCKECAGVLEITEQFVERSQGMNATP